MTLAGIGTGFVATDVDAFCFIFCTLVDVYTGRSFSSKAVEAGALYTGRRILAHVLAFACTLIATFHQFDRRLMFFDAFRTMSEPSSIAAEEPVRRRIHEHVTVRAFVNRNEVSIVRWQDVLPSGILGEVSVLDRRRLDKSLYRTCL